MLSVVYYANSKQSAPNIKFTLYTIAITNDGEFTNTDLFFTDDLPASLEFVIGSVKIDNVERDDLNLATGFALADLQPNGTITITNSAKVKYLILVIFTFNLVILN